MSKELKEIREGMRMLSHQRITMLLLLLSHFSCVRPYATP